MTGWDLAVHFQGLGMISKEKSLSQRKLEDRAIQSIIYQAKKIIGNLWIPHHKKRVPYSERWQFKKGYELSVEESFEEQSDLNNWDWKGVWVEGSVPKEHALMLTIDTSLSMTGEKLALTAVALAVVCLQFESQPFGVVTFDSEAKKLKAPFQSPPIEVLIRRFLLQAQQGYTHLERGLTKTIEMIAEQPKRPAYSTILLSDGKYTAGRDPTRLAPFFNSLSVLKMGGEKSSESLCQELARLGGGQYREVKTIEKLPQIMYALLQEIMKQRIAS